MSKLFSSPRLTGASQINPDIFKSYDIRGIYPKDINEENVVPITRAIYKLFQTKLNKNPLKIALGRDMRISSPALYKSISETLVQAGAEVIDLGIVPTTTFYFAVFKNQFDGGIQITASHNPKEHNGLKMVILEEKALLKIGKNSGMDQIKKWSIEGVNLQGTEGGKKSMYHEAVEEEVENALKIVGFPKIEKYRVVADPANALGALYIDALFKRIPCELIRMNFELDGNFPAHQADPLQHQTLVDLQKRVLQEKASLGLAADGDGDRLFFIDDKGQIVPPSIITALIAKEILKKNKGKKIIADIRYILTPKKIVEESEGIFVLTRVGHAFISEKMRQVDAIFAGESSSHYFFKETGFAESQVPVILFVLKVMTDQKKKLSELVADLKRSHESGEINFRVKNALELIDVLRDEFSDGEISTIDGVAVSFPDWRFSLRTSNTEPVLRLNIESLEGETVQKRKEQIIGLIEKHGQFDTS